jgi:hypothetical protein
MAKLPVIQRGTIKKTKRKTKRKIQKGKKEKIKIKKPNQCRGIKDETGLNDRKAIE